MLQVVTGLRSVWDMIKESHGQGDIPRGCRKVDMNKKARLAMLIEYLQQGEETEETGSESTHVNIAGRGSASVLERSRGRGLGSSQVTSRSGGLGLSVTDLGNDGTRWFGSGKAGSRSGSLGLSVTDLGNDRTRWFGSGKAGSRCGGLRLAVGKLRDGRTRWLGSGGAGSRGGSLGLTVGKLRNSGSRWQLGSGGGSLRLAIGDLGDSRGLRGRSLRGWSRAAASSHDRLDIDLDALHTLRVAVQVVEIARQALPEGGVTKGTGDSTAQGKSVVGAKGESLVLFRVGLGLGIELELVVAGDVSLTTSLVFQDTILERDGQGTVELTPLEITLRGWLINRLDVELLVGGSNTARRCSSLRHGSGQRGGREGEGNVNLHDERVIEVMVYW
jgi:hypothetical protein